MNEFFAYIIKSSLCTAVFYSLYYLIMRKNTFFKLNRAYLFISLILSYVMPLININFENTKNPTSPGITNYVREIVIYANAPAKKVAMSQISFTDAITIGFIVISILLTAIYLFSIIRINLMKYRADRLKYKDIKLFVLSKEIPAFSFIKSIFMSKEIYQSDSFNEIFDHEKIHIKHYHSLDLIFISILKSIFWINPFVYLYEKAFRENHEYTADNFIINQGVTVQDYKKLMLSSTIKDLYPAPVNSFSMNMLKKRFNMLNKNNSSKKEFIKYIMIIPVTAMLFFAFSCNNNKSMTPVQSDDEKYAKYELTCFFDENGKTIPYDSARRYLSSYSFEDLTQNVPLTEEAIKAGISGAVVNLKIVKDPNGKIIYVKPVNGKIAEQDWKSKIGYGLEEKAVQIIKSLPQFTQVEHPNGKPAYEHSIERVQFGDLNIWRAKEEHPIQVSMRNSKSNDPAGEMYNVNTDSMMQFISKNIKYPESGIKGNISGTVFVKFNIDQKGKISKIKITKGINPDFDNEVLRVVNMFNTSGVDFGYGNDFEINLPVTFKLR